VRAHEGVKDALDGRLRHGGAGEVEVDHDGRSKLPKVAGRGALMMMGASGEGLGAVC